MEKKKKNKVRINLTIDYDLNESWRKVVAKYGWTKSGMLEDMLNSVLPLMSIDNPRDILVEAVKEFTNSMSESDNFVEGYSHE